MARSRSSLSFSEDGDRSTSRRRRTPKACDRCRIKKSKCDGESRCSKCIETRSKCTYSMRRGRETRSQELRMLDLMDQALQRLYWACRNKEDLPESLVRSYKAQITTKDILEGLGLDAADLNDSETRKSSTDTTASSAESQNSVQPLPNKAALDEEININPIPSPLPSPSPSVSAAFDFGFDPPSSLPSRTQSTDTDTDTKTFTLPDLSASASPFDATRVQRLSTLTLPPPRYPPIPHRDSCQLHLVCRMMQLERQNRSLSKTSGASFLQRKDVPLPGVGNGDKGTENLSRAASCHDFKQQVLGNRRK